MHAAGTGAVLAQQHAPEGTRDPGLPDAVLEAVLAAILTDAPPSRQDDVRTLAITFATTVDDLPALTPAERTLLREWLHRATTAQTAT
ncbi:hypothetical protein GCM10025868_30670 [Angustibacter aerolatus]|uniref:Uncharacterized protein n=1 Tax=Angustibacter aerolatus TaxID=1162965 RepID=A0ABQ6JJ76_9ACTN|nr:hypothetical protein [Angustibacter aerolatus]GMA87817.1 hypothetical protein GCM10025868_30670 [Angustibacter aerolatus]